LKKYKVRIKRKYKNQNFIKNTKTRITYV